MLGYCYPWYYLKRKIFSTFVEENTLDHSDWRGNFILTLRNLDTKVVTVDFRENECQLETSVGI